jgi:hypothetical protein
LVIIAAILLFGRRMEVKVLNAESFKIGASMRPSEGRP